jgi:hypothetical protein
MKHNPLFTFHMPTNEAILEVLHPLLRLNEQQGMRFRFRSYHPVMRSFSDPHETVARPGFLSGASHTALVRYTIYKRISYREHV